MTMSGFEDSDDILDDASVTSPLLGSRVGSGFNEPYRPGSAIGVPSTVLEPPNVYRSRWRSIRVMYLTMFLSAITFTITMSSLWPFLEVLDGNVDESFLGWVVASYSLGQLIASPFFGGWANLRKSSREPLVVSLILTTLSNLFYTYLQSIPEDRQYMMILARGLIGFSAGNVAVVRSYVSGATTMKERTSSMANVSICQAMGFILGPVIQAALVPISYPGASEVPEFHFNMYTAPGFFAVVVAFINLLLLIFVFKEHHVYDDDSLTGVQGKPDTNTGSEELSNSFQAMEYKLDYLAVVSSLFLFFVVLFMFTVFETIGTPLSMHMYAWSKSTATLYQGIILGSAGTLSIAVFIVVKALAKRFNERFLLLAGFLFCLCGYFIYIPWGDDLPPRGLAPLQNTTHPVTGPEALAHLFTHAFYGEKFNIDDITAKHRHKRSAFIKNQKLASSSPFLEEEHSQLPSRPTSTSHMRKVQRSDVSSLLNGDPEKLLHSDFIKTFKVDRDRNLPHVIRTLFDHVTSISTSTSTPMTDFPKRRFVKQEAVGDLLTVMSGNPKYPSQEYFESSSDIESTLDPDTSTHSSTTTSSHASSSQSTISTQQPSTPTHSSTSPTSHQTTKTSSQRPTSGSTTDTSTHSSTTPASHPSTYTSTLGPNVTSGHSNGSFTPEGCPWDYDWCAYVPVIHLAQYLVGTVFISIGYPMCNLLCYTIYSKVLGPKPQGLWMGWLTASGSLARTVGPIYVSQIYDSYGPQVTFGSSSCFIFCTIVFYLIVFRRLIPFSFKQKALRQFGGSNHRRTQ